MLKVTALFLRGKRSKAAGSLRSLRQQLTDLKAANAAATAQLTERRRLYAMMQRQRWEQQQRGHQDGAFDSSSTSTPTPAAMAEAARKAVHADALKLLPRNPALESAIAFALRENRDARTELEFTRHLLGSTLLSLASPVGPWDPYDVKPQVFALDSYLALPVFTSLEYLQLFCQRFGFTARDPSGVLWADGTDSRGSSATHGQARLMPAEEEDTITHSMWWGKESLSQREDRDAAAAAEVRPDKEAETSCARSTAHESPQCTPQHERSSVSTPPLPQSEPVGLDAASLFDDLEGPESVADAPLQPSADCPSASTGVAEGSATTPRLREKKKRRSKGKLGKKPRRVLKTKARKEDDEPAHDAEAAGVEAAKQSFWTSVSKVSPFQFKQATPLPAFGPFVHPFFIGYFADINTLLHNASIVPEKVDIVLNPTSPTEFVLAREATDRVLHHDQLLLLAYQRVMKELQREFSGFFSRYCPEVLYARSACIPHPLDRRATERALRASREYSQDENPLQDQRARTQLLRESTYTGGVGYDIAILIRSEDLAATYRCLQWGKERCLLMGHPDLDLLPEDAAAGYVVEASQVFYKASERGEAAFHSHQDDPQHGDDNAHNRNGVEGQAKSADSDAMVLSVFRKVGEAQTINITQPADSYFHDPTNTYTEAHAIFTEELKVKHGQR